MHMRQEPSMDFLKSAVASAIAKGSALPYTIGDRLDNGESIWTMHNATKKVGLSQTASWCGAHALPGRQVSLHRVYLRNSYEQITPPSCPKCCKEAPNVAPSWNHKGVGRHRGLSEQAADCRHADKASRRIQIYTL